MTIDIDSATMSEILFASQELARLYAVGVAIEKLGYDVEFCKQPGCVVTLFLTPSPAPSSHEDPFAPITEIPPSLRDDLPAAPSPAVAADPVKGLDLPDAMPGTNNLAMAAPVAGGAAANIPKPVEAEQTSVQDEASDGRGAAVDVTAPPPAAPDPVSLSKPDRRHAVVDMPVVKATKPAKWTAAEDDALIKIVCDQLRNGMSRKVAEAWAAVHLDRPLQGLSWRLAKILNTRLTEALAVKIIPVPAAPVAAAPLAAPIVVPAKPSGTAKKPLLPADADRPTTALYTHLFDLPHKGAWDLARDLMIMQDACDGLDMAAIALNLGLSAGDVAARFDLLTDLDKGTKKRRFSRISVRDALQQFCGQAK